MRCLLALTLILTLTSSVAYADPRDAEASARGGHGSAEDADSDTDETTDTAEEQEDSSPPPRRRTYDYSGYSNGPARVRHSRGASGDRAEELGLGSPQIARQALRGVLDGSWQRSARGRNQGRLLWPIDEGHYVRGYGYVRRTRPDLLHRGVDISAPEGTPIRAAIDGMVIYAGVGLRGYGNVLVVLSRNGWVTLYAHTSRITVPIGYRVRRGERVALVGNTGISHGPHLHFELRHHGRAHDPVPLFDGGPENVRQRALAAFRAGRVPEPQALSAEDRAPHSPLRPFREAQAQVQAQASAVASAAPPSESSSSHGPQGEDNSNADAEGEQSSTASRDTDTERYLGAPLGSRGLAFRLTGGHAPDEALLASVEGRTFRNLLWPVRGEARERWESRAGRLRLDAEEGTAIRAVADGRVVYAGPLGRRGQTIVLVHQSGWVTSYASASEVSVEVGQRVRRGEWIGRVGHSGAGSRDRLELELFIEGQRRDPRPLIVQRPGAEEAEEASPPPQPSPQPGPQPSPQRSAALPNS